MFEFIVFIRSSWSNIDDFLSSISFQFGSVEINIMEILFGFMALSFVISVFWKGAKA